MLPIRKNGYGGECRRKHAMATGGAGLIQSAFDPYMARRFVSQVIVKMRIICDNTMD
jgi:hypothetical protein